MKDDVRWCPLARQYDPDIHDAIAQLRTLDGSIPAHAKHGPPVNFFAPEGQVKFWVKKDATAFGFFLFYALDKAVCPYLATLFEMPILHPTTADEVDSLLAATVDM